MIKTCEHAGLTPELLLDLFQVTKSTCVRPHFLDGAHTAFKNQVFGLVDGTHSTLADELYKLVA
jgi:hypothetical protein